MKWASYFNPVVHVDSFHMSVGPTESFEFSDKGKNSKNPRVNMFYTIIEKMLLSENMRMKCI